MGEKGEQRVGLCYCSTAVAAAAAAHITTIPIAPAAPCCGGSDVATQCLCSWLSHCLFEQAPFVLVLLSFWIIHTCLGSFALPSLLFVSVSNIWLVHTYWTLYHALLMGVGHCFAWQVTCPSGLVTSYLCIGHCSICQISLAHGGCSNKAWNINCVSFVFYRILLGT